ncbi:MAG: hypothetical protein ABJC62_01445 [Frankiaceae bacterium]|jgi:hypothetical protein
MMAPPRQSTPLVVPVPRLSGKQALRDAERDLLASQQAARRALELISAYEARHGEQPLCR